MFVQLIIASIGLLILGIFSISVCVRLNVHGWLEALSAIVGALSLVGSLCAFFVVVALTYSWESAKYQAQIINREYGTDYSQEEVFFARSVINTIRHLDRKRIDAKITLEEPSNENP